MMRLFVFGLLLISTAYGGAPAMPSANELPAPMLTLEDEDLTATGNALEDAVFLEMMSQQLPDAANIGYVPTAVPFDNPLTLSEPVPSIPNTPDCTVRPQTIVEIKRMRRAASRIAQMIQTEIVIMEKRKTYVEQMTSYLNDRIRELNKVKQELEQENRWIEVSNERIAELAQKEKLIKLQDVLACLNNQQSRLTGDAGSKTGQIAKVKAAADAVAKNMEAIKGNIDKLSGSKGGGKDAAAKPAAF